MALLVSGGGNSDAFETSLTFPVNVGSGSNRYMVGFVGQSTDATPDLTSASQITLNGSSTGVTLAGTATNPIGQTGCVGRWFYIEIPSGTTGTVNLVVNPGAGSTARKIFVMLAVYDGIFGIRSSGYGSNTFDANPTATVSSATGDEVVLFVANVAGGASLTASSPATALSGFSGTNFSVHGLRQDGASSVVIDGTYGSSQEYATAYFSLIQSAPAPTAASNVRVTDLTAGGCTVRWNDNSSDETGFKVEIAESPYSSWSAVSGSPAAANATSIVLSGLSSTPKKVRVIATNASGDATPAEIANAFTPLAPAKLRPASDITVGSWVSSLGGALYAALDETSADDADYVSIAGTGTFEVKLGAGADPGVHYGHTVRYRLQGDGAKQYTVRLVQGSTIISTDPTTRTPPAGSWTTYSWTPTEAEAANISDYTDLRLRFTVA